MAVQFTILGSGSGGNCAYLETAETRILIDTARHVILSIENRHKDKASADALLIDEMAGRAVALREGVEIIGLVGVCLTAKRAGLLAEVGPLLNDLERRARFRISAELKAQALRSVGE